MKLRTVRTTLPFIAAAARNTGVCMLIVLLPAVLMAGPAAQAAQSPVGMGTANTFAVLAGTTITNKGMTTITGDVGLHPGSSVTGFGACPAANCVTLSGAKHVADAVAKKAKVDLVNSYVDAAGRTPVTRRATELGGATLKAGVYDSASGTFGITGSLTLDAENNPDAVFIFEMASTLITASASKVGFINGGNPCNVFWKVGSSATLATGSAFIGNIFALTSIAAQTGATIEGRLLARNGAVTLDTNTITRGACSSTAHSAPTAKPKPTAAPTTSPTKNTTAGGSGTPTAGSSTSTTVSGSVPRPPGTGVGRKLPRTGVNIELFVLVGLGLIASGELMRRGARAVAD